MKTINVAYALHETEETTVIPVNFESEQNGKEQVLKCSIALPKEKLPDWLNLTAFEVPIIHDEMGTSILYSNVGDVKNTDTALFISRVIETIRLHERLN